MEDIGCIGSLNPELNNGTISESEQSYRVFVELSSEGIWRIEFSNNGAFDISMPIVQQVEYFFENAFIAECNAAMARMYGFKCRDEFKKMRLNEFFPRSQQVNVQQIHNFIKQGYRLTGVESIERDNKGNIKYFINNLLGIVKDKKLCGIWGTQRDVTEYKQADETLLELNFKLAQKNSELLKINNDLDNFIFSVSHDLNAPMSNIEGLINILKLNEAYNQAENKTIIDLMGVAVSKFKKTLKELSEVTKAQLNATSATKEVVFNEILEEIKFSIKDILQDTQTIICQDFSLCERVYFQKLSIKSIIYNLLSNAIKYRHPDRKPEIHIKTINDPDHLVIEVRDNGLGIPEEQLPQIFTMFKRLHSHVEGTGVGLYILKRIVENHAGRVEVESKINEGTCFRIFLKLNQ